MINFARGEPNIDLFDSKLLKNIGGLTHSKENFFYYIIDDRGDQNLRERFCMLFADKASTPDNIIITYGALFAIDLLFNHLRPLIRSCYVAEPTYRQPLHLMKKMGCPIYPIPLDKDGNIDQMAFKASLKDALPALIYLIPHLNNPNGRSLTEKDKAFLAMLSVTENNLFIIEDDVYNDLFFDGYRRTSIYGLATEISFKHNIFRLHSLSKILMPGLRLGFIECSQKNVEELINIKVDYSQSALLSFIAFNLLNDVPIFHEHLTNLRLKAFKRKSLAVKTLCKHQDIYFEDVEGGYFLWLSVPSYINTQELLVESKKKKVMFLPGHEFFITPQANYIRLSYAFCNEDQIEPGIDILSNLIRQHGQNSEVTPRGWTKMDQKNDRV